MSSFTANSRMMGFQESHIRERVRNLPKTAPFNP